MTELHPSSSAIGTHLDETVEIAALAHRYYEEEGCPEGRSLEHWTRAEREYRAAYNAPAPATSETRTTQAGIKTEEMMHLAM
jgi:Protein of unknown function (DUF2934)